MLTILTHFRSHNLSPTDGLIASHESVDAIPVVVHGFPAEPMNLPIKRKTFADIDDDYEWPPCRRPHALWQMRSNEKITSFDALLMLAAEVKPVDKGSAQK